jgi:hypothetical protein
MRASALASSAPTHRYRSVIRHHTFGQHLMTMF